ncbi:DegV family protein [Lachnospiraceae bacterium HCP1S3_C3]|nr:DegV family protein [Lachnospiraceae bacterium]MDD6857968.1 DegV family protein [Lachnospiraceae bacterium]
MEKIAIVTDSNSGITQKQAEQLGVFVVPMPFMINGETFYEGINLSVEEFYKKMAENADISTSQPAPGDVTGLWDNILKEYDSIVHIPMSSGLSGSCQTAAMLAQDYDGRVQVVDNQRISVTQRQSVLDAMELADRGMNAEQIKEFLVNVKFDSSIYIMVDTLKYLKKGGRITPAAAAFGEILRIKPVLQIQGEKLDAFAKVRSVKQAKSVMIKAMKSDMEKRFGGINPENIWLEVAHTQNEIEAEKFKEEILEEFPGFDIHIDPLSLSVSCHIGPGALAIACSKKI